jgi:hypothetical protein
VANAAAYVALGESSKFLVSGNVNATYGQPAASAAAFGFGDGTAVGMVAKPLPGFAGQGGRA